MKIAFVINDFKTENPLYSTPLMAYTAEKMGHEVYMMSVGNLVYQPNGHVGGHARMAPKGNYKNSTLYFNALKGKEGKTATVTTEDLDVIFLRNNPSDDLEERPWAQTAGVVFGQLAMNKGVIVLNNPSSISDTNDKAYLEHFPAQIRPKTMITRNADDIKRFYEEHKKQIVLKPLQGSGGKDVFLVKKDETNLNQIVEAIAREGYVIAQEYLPEAKLGDIRLFMMNGKILTYKGKIAAFRRVNKQDDFRSNMHAGGEAEPVEITEREIAVADVLTPKLRQDGIFLVGLDIVGDKLMEINVFSPGGFQSLLKLTGVNFAEAIIKNIEQKVYHKNLYNGKLSNIQLAVME